MLWRLSCLLVLRIDGADSLGPLNRSGTAMPPNGSAKAGATKKSGDKSPPPAPLLITVITGSNAETTTIKGGAALNSPTRVAAAIADGRSTGAASSNTLALNRIRLLRWCCVLCLASALVMTVAGVLTWFDATTTSVATSLVTPVQCYSLPTFGICIALMSGAGMWLPTQRKAFLQLAWVIGCGCWLVPMIVLTAGYGLRASYYDDTVRVDASNRYDSDESIRAKYATSTDFENACIRNAFILTVCAVITGGLLLCCIASGLYVRSAFVEFERRLAVKQANAPVPAATAAIVVRSKAATTAPQPHKWVWAAPSAEADATSNAWAVFKPKPLTTTTSGDGGGGGGADSASAGSAKSPTAAAAATATAGRPNNIAISSGAGAATLAGSSGGGGGGGGKPSASASASAAAGAGAGGSAIARPRTPPAPAAPKLARVKTTDVSKTPPASNAVPHRSTTHHHHTHLHRKKSHKPGGDASGPPAVSAGQEKVEDLTAEDTATDSAGAASVSAVPMTLITRSARYRGEKTLGFVESADEFSPPPPPPHPLPGAADSKTTTAAGGGGGGGASSPTSSEDLPLSVTPAFLLDSKPPLLSAASSSGGVQTERRHKHKHHHHHKPKPPAPAPAPAPAAADSKSAAFESVLPSS